MSTIIEWYKNGGPIMNFILLVGVAGIAIFIERFYVIVIKSKINGRAFIGNPTMALLISVLFGAWSLGTRCGFHRGQILKFTEECTRFDNFPRGDR